MRGFSSSITLELMDDIKERCHDGGNQFYDHQEQVLFGLELAVTVISLGPLEK